MPPIHLQYIAGTNYRLEGLKATLTRFRFVDLEDAYEFAEEYALSLSTHKELREPADTTTV